MGCICKPNPKPIPLVQTKVPTKKKQNLQVYQIKQSNQNIENFETNKTQIKQTNNNNIINNEENNFTQNNITNTNNNIPKLPKYDPNLLLSTNSLVSNASSEQHEILINGQYSLKSGVLDNSGLINYLKDEDKYANVNNVPISESFSYFNKNNENKIDILNNKSGTFVGSSNLKIPVMQSQASKSSQYYCNKGNKINISLSGSGTGSGVYIYYPNKDNTPIPDLDNIDEKIQDQV